MADGLKPLQVTRESRPGMYADGGGLYLQVTSTEDGFINKSWVFRYRFNGHVSRNGKPLSREMGLGSYKDFTLAEARERARAQRQLIADGLDPLGERDRRRREAAGERAKSKTFPECADAYAAAHGTRWKSPKTRTQWRKRLADYAEPVFRDTPVRDIDLAMVADVLEPIWLEKTETARKVRSGIEWVLGWAKVKGYRNGDNPAAWTDNLQHLLAKPSEGDHHPSLPYVELPGFMAELRACGGTAARGLEFMILCATRTGDVIGSNREEKPPMKWPHVNLNERVWTIPSTKTDGELRVPLSDAAVDLLSSLDRQGEIVFPGESPDNPMSNMSMAAVIKRLNKARSAQGLPRYVDPKEDNRDVVPHGFRSTFKTWAEEQTSFPSAVIEAALAHAKGDKVEEAYMRGDLFEKRRKLMHAWARYCARPVKQSAEVVPLRA